jgi:hypothetical protein
VPLAVGEAVVGQPLHGRHVDAAAVRRPCRLAGIVVQDDEHVRCIFRRLGIEKRIPVRFGFADIEIDRAFGSIVPLNGRGM